ncbi:MAG: GatB/YqeY domain-containing protein [SAR324 cluster bacterium]|nr:GatB/YqeY domain-containing protein [SAR324 cluster bacterium]
MIDLDAAIKKALLAKEQAVLTAYRALKTKAGMKLTEPGRDEKARGALSEEEQTALVRKEIKERQESNEYLDPSRPEYAVNTAIIAELEQHLPAAMSAEDTEAAIRQAISAVQPAGPKEMGKVMAALRQAAPGIDMGAASARVKALLAQESGG